MDDLVKVVLGVVGVCGAYVGIISSVDWLTSIEQNYTVDLDGDGRKDLFLQTKWGHKYILLQQEDGTYRLSHEALKEIRKDGEARADSLEAQISKNLEKIK